MNGRYLCGRVLLPAVLTLLVTGRSSAAEGSTFAGNAQHTSNYQAVAQNLNAIRWSTRIDLNNSGAFAHYGAPLISSANTVFVPVKTATDGFQVNVFNGSTGAAKYSLTTDYVLPSHNWIPTYNPTLATTVSSTRLYYAGTGGTIYYIDNPDSAPPGAPVHQAFYGLASYTANSAAFNSSVFINTPITADSNGNVFFGFRVQGTAPAPLSTTQSGFARIDPNGTAIYVLAGTAAADAGIGRDSHNSAPALSNDQSTLYVVVKSPSTDYYGYLLGLDASTLATKYKVLLKDPRNGNSAGILDDSTASPMVAPDNDVYLGIFSNPDNGSRGFMLRFSSDLATQKTPGAFGWDYTPAIVPATMVTSYTGSSPYLIFSKYNNYANTGDGDGVNKIALLDPNASQTDPHPTANGLVEMREVLTVLGVTPDAENLSSTFPNAVREWCINTPAVNPATNSIFIPSEDGRIYRWDLSINSLSQSVMLGSGVGEPYVPTSIGPDGTVYTLNGGSFFALGNIPGVGIGLTSSVPDVRSVVAGQSLTFTAAITNTSSSGLAPTGTVSFQDVAFQGTTPVTTTLASNVPLDSSGHASLVTSALAAGHHLITATYSGDGNFTGGKITGVQNVHANASKTTLSASPNPSSPGQLVTFTATVGISGAGTGAPTGMVTFAESNNFLAQVPLSSGSASFGTSALSAGNHTITAFYSSDSIFASSSGTVVSQQMIQVTVSTNVSGLSFQVDGSSYTTPQTFSWVPGASHTLASTATQAGASGTQQVWSSWSDSGTISHSVSPTANSTYTANFTTQYLLTMSAGTGGTSSPPSGYFNSGQTVQITATPSSGYVFSAWTGSGTGSYTGSSAQTNVTMNGPLSEAASFTAAGMTKSAGDGQSTTIGHAFGTALQVTVKDSNNIPLQGVTVTFTAPSSGPSGTFPGGALTATATTNGSGIATAPTFTANSTVGGPYNVTAR